MRKINSPLALFAVLAVSLGLVAPAFADTYTVFSQPTTTYLADTVDYGGGNGSGGSISSLGVFTFGSSVSEAYVPGTWSTWGAPPNTQSSDPSVLTYFASNLLLTLSAGNNIAGLEIEPDDYGTYSFAVSFYDENGALIDTITQSLNGSSGAQQFALLDTTPGQTIGSIDISSPSSAGGFAMAQLSAGVVPEVAPTPEPSSLILLGTGLAGVAGMARRRFLSAAKP